MSEEPDTPDSQASDSDVDDVLVDGSTLNSLLADRAAKRRRLARKAELARISRAKKKSKIEELEAQVMTMQREIEIEEEKAAQAEKHIADQSNNQSIDQVKTIDRLLAIHSSSRAEIESKLQVFQSECRKSSSNKDLVKIVDALASSIRDELDSGIDAFAQLRTVLTETQINALISFIETHGEILLSAR